MNTCANCGFQVTPDDAFCAACGSAQLAPVAQPAPMARLSAERDAGGGAGFGSPPTAPVWAATAGPGYEPPAGVNAAQEPPFPGPRAPEPAGYTGQSWGPGSLELRYLRQTRTACVFIAVVVGIFTALIVIGTIWGLVSLVSIRNDLNNGLNNVNNSNCSSVGGTNPDC